MTQINIFKINAEKVQPFGDSLNRAYKFKGEKVCDEYKFKFYYCSQSEPQEVSWKWVFADFEISCEKSSGFPKGVLIIQREDGGCEYAISFGSGHFSVDPYSDRDFAFDYASRVKIHRTRLTATTNTTSHRNKTISAYKDFPYLEINSGESYVKIKVEIDDPASVDIIDQTVEIGSSIKFLVKDVSFAGLVKLITYIEKVLTGPKVTQIPMFKVVTKSDEIDILESSLKSKFDKSDAFVTLSEFDVVGTSEVFNRADEFEFTYGRIKSRSSKLDRDELMGFFAQHKITSVEEMFKVRIGFCFSGVRKYSKSVHSLIDFMDEKRKALLIAGKWHVFNDDFLQYLRQSLDEIEVMYNPRYNIRHDTFDAFFEDKYSAECHLPEYAGKGDEEIRQLLRRKYYPERAFNLLCEKDGFAVKDRGIATIGGMPYELCDLRKGDAIYTVKRGVGSSDLSYAVTQSEATIDLFLNRQVEEPRPKKVVLWLIFTRKNVFSIVNNRLNWDEVGMLLLKIKIDTWKKKIRLANMEPEIWVNYEGLPE